MGINQSRNELIAQCCESIYAYTLRFFSNGLYEFMNEWKENDWLFERQLTVEHGKNCISGMANGINTHGKLLIDTSMGIQEVSSGEVSIILINVGQIGSFRI